TAELAHRDVEGDARAGRRLVEDHRQHLAGERTAGGTAVVLPARLHGAARLDDAAQLFGRNVEQVEEGPDAACPPHAAPCPLSCASDRGAGGAARWVGAPGSASSASLMISGGRPRTTLSPAPMVIIFSPRRASTKPPAGTTARRPTSRPSPRTSAIT